MPQMDLGVRVAMVALVIVLIAIIVVYHVWLDRLQQRGARRETARAREAEGLSDVRRR